MAEAPKKLTGKALAKRIKKMRREARETQQKIQAERLKNETGWASW